MAGQAECNKCGETIVWLKTRAGKNIMVDLPMPDGTDENTVYDKHIMKCHWDRCGAEQVSNDPKPEVEGFPDARKPSEDNDDGIPF